MELHQQIEGVLFYKATPIKKSVLARLFGITDAVLTDNLNILAQRLTSGATRLLMTNTDVELVTAPELDQLIESIRKDDMKRDIGKAGAETLAIIIYRGPISRAEIDRIRGVNSGFILRNLLVRGLIERTATQKSTTYQVTPSLLAHLGITSVTELSGFTDVMNALDAYEQSLETSANELS